MPSVAESCHLSSPPSSPVRSRLQFTGRSLCCQFNGEKFQPDAKEIGALLRRYIQRKGDRLDVGRLNNLVYVKFNATLMNKHKRLREKGKKIEVQK
ncbi:hypothetical protein LWI28_002663 [Acer negundo]|uniref:Uncharacterized protein n=1 Tax=Acer negundo TaxID=4023 RepID=A0AAD5IYD4_ACENE|nr:hypothetical protein LWI28_002663 [Acer negundo]